ncbi:rhodanese-like domain-containing protein [Streptomyces sp. NPDC054833]
MPHRNAPLTETGRLRPARCVVDDGWPVRRAAERFQVSHTTASRWANRYRRLGIAGMSDRSSRPHHQPAKTPARIEAEVIRLRREHRIGPLRLAGRTGIAPSTAHRILVRNSLPVLAACDRATDVRTPGEFQTAHIAGAYNVPLDTLREHRAELLAHLDEDVVLVCRSGARVAQAEQALAEAGLPDLRVLDGGMVAWEASGAPVNGGRSAGTWSARSAWSPDPSCSSPVWWACSCPECT